MIIYRYIIILCYDPYCNPPQNLDENELASMGVLLEESGEDLFDSPTEEQLEKLVSVFNLKTPDTKYYFKVSKQTR